MSKSFDPLELGLDLALSAEEECAAPYVIGDLVSYATPRVAENGQIDRSRVIPGCVVRELELEDMLGAEAKGVAERGEAAKAGKYSLKNIRESHHRVAKMMAMNLSVEEISLSTGYKPATLKTYQQDPSIMELIAHYRGKGDELIVDLSAKYKALVGDAHGELTERLAEDPEGFSNGLLLEIVKDLGDRVGMGPASKMQIGVTHSIDEETIKAIKENADGLHKGVVTQGKSPKISGEVIDGEYSEVETKLRRQEIQRSSSEGSEVSTAGGEEAECLAREAWANESYPAV